MGILREAASVGHEVLACKAGLSPYMAIGMPLFKSF